MRFWHPRCLVLRFWAGALKSIFFEFYSCFLVTALRLGTATEGSCSRTLFGALGPSAGFPLGVCEPLFYRVFAVQGNFVPPRLPRPLSTSVQRKSQEAEEDAAALAKIINPQTLQHQFQTLRLDGQTASRLWPTNYNRGLRPRRGAPLHSWTCKKLMELSDEFPNSHGWTPNRESSWTRVLEGLVTLASCPATIVW